MGNRRAGRARRLTGWVALAGLLALTGCAGEHRETKAGMPSQASGDSRPLYERLGGKPAIIAVVDDFVARVAADGRINGKFANADIPRLKRMLVDQICEASGGPCKYTGRDMRSAHAGMRITDAEFDALVEDLVSALTKYHVADREKNALLSVLGPMRPDIVGQ